MGENINKVNKITETVRDLTPSKMVKIKRAERHKKAIVEMNFRNPAMIEHPAFTSVFSLLKYMHNSKVIKK